MSKWDKRYLDLAKFIASWSKDPSTKCGAVIVNRYHQIVSIGYNGFPTNIADTEDRLNDRDIKLAITIHAERNALIFAKEDLHGCTLYTWPMQCCSECAAMMIQVGIARHVAPIHVPARWQQSFDLANQIFAEADIQITYIGKP
jgi:dCMP deaminase